MIPADPIILLSFVNTRLRDGGESLEELCAAEGLDRSALEEKLAAAGYRYSPEQNRFI